MIFVKFFPTRILFGSLDARPCHVCGVGVDEAGRGWHIIGAMPTLWCDHCAGVLLGSIPLVPQ